jgi:hypothetical protein
MMADTGIGRILPTEVISPIQSYDRGTGSLHEDVGALRRERTLKVGQGVRKKGRGKQESAQPEMIVVVEQWNDWFASSRVARTVVLKLKTAEFKILTRSHTPPSPPSSCEELTGIALSLRARVTLEPQQRFRLVE